MKEICVIVTLKKTGEKLRMFKKLSWNKIYYSFDGEKWENTKKGAFLKASHFFPINKDKQ